MKKSVRQTVTAPYFVIQVDEQGLPITSRPLKTVKEALTMANSGIGFTAFAVGTIAEFDRTDPPIDDVKTAALELLIELTTDRTGSCPQNLPVALYRKVQRLANQAKSARARESQ